MKLNEFLEVPEKAMWNTIMKELKVNEATLEKTIEDFKDWVEDEPHMPSYVDEQLIRNIIIHSQCYISKAKLRFQRYLEHRTTYEAYYTNRNVDDEYFEKFSLHRQVMPIQRYVPGGYRLIYLGFLPNVDDFDFERLLHLLYIYFDFVLCEESCSGYIALYDLQHFKREHLETIDIQQFADAFHLIFNLRLCTVKEIHFINVPSSVPGCIRSLVMQLDKVGLGKRTYFHKSSAELKEHIPNDILPKQYGGEGDDLEKLSQGFKKYFVENKEWSLKVDNLKYTGSVTETKYGAYHLDYMDNKLWRILRKI